VADNFGYCGSLAGENTANAENEMAVTSAKRKEKEDEKILPAPTSGRDWLRTKRIVKSLR